MPPDRKKSQNATGAVSAADRRPQSYCGNSLQPLPPTKTTSGGKCRSCCRRFTAFLFSHVGLCGLVVGYSIMGAFAFRALESPYEEEKAKQVKQMRQETVHKLWEITVEFNVLYKDNWTKTVTDEIEKFQRGLIAAVKDGYDGKELRAGQQWSFSGAFLYSLTVITTIGYGNIAPKTDWGKIVTILYAIAGIPLMLLYLTNIGDLLAKAFKYVYGHLCSCKGNGSNRGRRRRPEQYRIHHIVVHDSLPNNSLDAAHYVNKFNREEELKMDSLGASPHHTDAEEYDVSSRNGHQRVTVPITLCLFLITVYICGGAALFAVWEEWNYLDGYYFCFVTLSTIGFGDLVPGDTVVSDSGSQEKLVICSLYLLAGMALIAMCFNLVQEEVVFKIRNLGQRLGIITDDPDD